MTSRDLARLAGVSTATVSRAFGNDTRIKPETRALILTLAKEHGYRPNAMAASLNNSKSRLVALVVNTVANPSEAEGLDALIHRLQENRRMPLILRCADSKDRGLLMSIASTYQVDHVVLFSDMVTIEDLLGIFRRATPIIASTEPLGGHDLSDVRLDSARASAEVVDRLVAAGRRQFAYLSGRASSFVDKARMTNFAEALARHGLGFIRVDHGDYSYDSGYKEAVLMLRRSQPDVVICGNDVMAVGVKDAAALLGLRLPQDLAIVGHDGVGLAAWDCHAITTIAPAPHASSDAIAEMIELPPGAPAVHRVLECHVRWGRTTPEGPQTPG